MNALIQRLKTQAAKPGLWIERLSIFTEPDVAHGLRDIAFKRGLNIVWAHEPDERAYSGIRAAGHGVGKSSMCLLLRYCLGDEGKTVKDLLQEITSEFPQGGVGIIIHAGEETFSVFRHFSARRSDVYAEGDELESCFVTGRCKPYREFVQRFSERILAGVSPRTLPETGQAIIWNHLLAWITRDQSARFKSFFSWREGEGTGLLRPKQDPPEILRIVLGLLKADEPRQQTGLSALDARLKTARENEQQLRQAPELIRRRIESNVRAWLSTPADLPMRSDDLFEDSVEARVKSATERAEIELKRLDEQENKLNEELVGLLAVQGNAQRGYEIADSMYKIADARRLGNEEEARKLAEQQQRLQSLAGNCEHGQVAFKKCIHIQKRLQTTNLEECREKVALAQSNAGLAAWATRTLADREQIKAKLDEANRRIDAKKADLNQVRMKRRTVQLDEDRGKNLLTELARWEKHSGTPETAEQLKNVAKECMRIEAEIDQARTRLEILRHEQSERMTFLNELVNLVTQALLSDQAFGTLDSRDEDRPFRLSLRGGEAYRVLEILVGDLVCLLDAASPASAFPALLIHDCPREADMGQHPYHDFLHLIERIECDAFRRDAPFQYIVTTTTPPPEHLQKPLYLRMELDPSRADGFLFKKRFVSPATASIV
jgi:hypothetical protein